MPFFRKFLSNFNRKCQIFLLKRSTIRYFKIFYSSKKFIELLRKRVYRQTQEKKRENAVCMCCVPTRQLILEFLCFAIEWVNSVIFGGIFFFSFPYVCLKDCDWLTHFWEIERNESERGNCDFCQVIWFLWEVKWKILLCSDVC